VVSSKTSCLEKLDLAFNVLYLNWTLDGGHIHEFSAFVFSAVHMDGMLLDSLGTSRPVGVF